MKYIPDTLRTVIRKYLILSIILFVNTILFAQNKAENNLDLESVSINIQFDKIGNYSFSSIYNYKNEDIFLPLDDIFRFLKIQINTSTDGSIVNGFLEENKRPYSIDLINKKLIYNNIEHVLTEKDFLFDMGTVFLSRKIFNSVFGFHVDFNFRNLTATFKADYELPVLRIERLELARKSIRNSNDNFVADTVLNRDYHWFKSGMIDWSYSGSQFSNGLGENRINLGVGAEVFGGQTDIALNYSDKYGFIINQQRYQWRWINTKSKLAKQVQIGRQFGRNISTLLSPVDGISITNAPTTVRKALGEYIINEMTNPDWTIELYINNVLVDFTKADASGAFSFTVPIVYGSSNIMLRFYGLNGEEHTEEKILYMPYNLLPKNEFEYRVTAGFMLDSVGSRFSHAEVNYGLTRGLTLGAGYEYLSSTVGLESGFPFASFSFQPIPKMILTAEYVHDVRLKSTLNYSFGKGVAADLNYTKYKMGQRAIIYNYSEERIANLTVPFRLFKTQFYTKSGFRQFVYPNFKVSSAEFSMNINVAKLNVSLGSFANWTDVGSTNIYSNLALGYRINTGLNLRFNSQYSYSEMKVKSFKVEMEKQIFSKGYLNVAYENSTYSNYQSLNLSLRYEFSFMSTYASSVFSSKQKQFSESVRGSLAFGSGNNFIYLDRQNAVGRSGISIIPFIDINHNNKFDANEVLVEKMNVRCTGGQVIGNFKDSIIRIIGLEPFVEYNLVLDETSLENVAWRIKNKNLQVVTDPNQFKKIYVPIQPVGEVSAVVINENGSGMGRILVNIYNQSQKRVAQVMTESDGFFSFMGLAPGKYRIEVDKLQLEKINSKSVSQEFYIKEDRQGDMVDVGDIAIKLNPTQQ